MLFPLHSPPIRNERPPPNPGAAFEKTRKNPAPYDLDWMLRVYAPVASLVSELARIT
jgi:hypothetical protein